MGPGPAGLPQLQYLFLRLICLSVPLAFVVLLIMLLFAGYKFIISGGDAKNVQSAKNSTIWAIIGVLFMALAWTTLKAVENFTGVEVTKFTLTSLPGVEGFTGSCWDTPPTSINQSAISQTQQKNNFTPSLSSEIEKQYPNSLPLGTCKDVGGFSFPVAMCLLSCQNPDEYLGRTNDLKAYVNQDVKELTKVLDKPILVNILGDAISTQIFKATGPTQFRFGGQGFLIANFVNPEIQGQTFFAEFDKDKIPRELINTKYEVQQMAKSFVGTPGPGSWVSERDLEDLGRVVIWGLACNNNNYLAITTASPLIYLYPSAATNIKLSINSSVISPLKQEENSWNILVKKDGTFEKTGRSYHFIPYEFLRRDFRRPDRGMVVNSEHLIGYLKDSLWKSLGLTNQEIEDYWKDLDRRIPKSPYYFISLIDRSEIDRVLPMEISPKPDTIIRNMTYILPLDKPFIPLPLPEIKAPKRAGFTILENGGFIDGQ